MKCIRVNAHTICQCKRNASKQLKAQSCPEPTLPMLNEQQFEEEEEEEEEANKPNVYVKKDKLQPRSCRNPQSKT